MKLPFTFDSSNNLRFSQFVFDFFKDVTVAEKGLEPFIAIMYFRVKSVASNSRSFGNFQQIRPERLKYSTFVESLSLFIFSVRHLIRLRIIKSAAYCNQILLEPICSM